MKAKKIYQISLVLGGLLLAFSGVACMVAGTLLDHDSVLMMVHESRSRTYNTQYWLGLPLIMFGGLLMLTSPSLHKRKRVSAFNVFVCIPLLSCALVAAVLHGTAYVHFLSIQQNRLYLKDHSYLCTEVNTDSGICQCSKREPFQSNPRIVDFPVPCSQQKSLVTFHGALLTFSTIAFALLLGILVICVIFILHCFKVQLGINSPTTGHENAGYSHVGRRAVSPPNPVASPGTTFHGLQDRPPSYESLMTSFSVTTLNMTSRDATNDITRGRNRPVSRQARVRYRGELSSRLNHGIPEQEESSSNEVSSSDERGNSNAEAQMIQTDEIDVTDAPNSNSASLRRNYVRQISDELDSTIRAITEDIRVLSNVMNNDNDDNNYGMSDSTRSESEGQAEAVSLELNNVRPGQNDEAIFQGRAEERLRDIRPAHRERRLTHDSSNVRSSEATPERTDQSLIGTRPSIDRERRWNNESHNTRSLRHNEAISEPSRTRNLPVVAQEESNSSLTHGRPLQRTLSNHSENGVYIDIRQSFIPAQSDSSRIAVRYRGQLDSNSVNRIANRSQLAHERENRTDIQNTHLSENPRAPTPTHEFVDSSDNTTANESPQSTSTVYDYESIEMMPSNTESSRTVRENRAMAQESPLASIEEGMHSLDSNNQTSSNESQSGQESVPLRGANQSVSSEDRNLDSAAGQTTENRTVDNREILI